MLDVKMAGIDYNKAGVDARALFSMTKTGVDAIARLGGVQESAGCVVLSTCNRTELWVSGCEMSPLDLLCAAKGVDAAQYRPLFTERAGHEAVTHLFELSCGLKSQVFGEDQIITQLGGALDTARENSSADAVLENLFRTAVTAAKRVKTELRLVGNDRSAAASTVRFLREKLGYLHDVPCMVIGNGEMGRLAATALAESGAAVTMTVRQYRHGEVEIPSGVRAVPYDQRLELLRGARVVISATTSPHFTLRAAEIAPLSQPTIFCDLAVPRDIDPAIASLDGASLYDTDDLCGGDFSHANVEMLARAREILGEYIADFESWYGFRGLVPLVSEISALAAEDMMSRVGKSIRGLELQGAERARLAARVNDAAQKTVGRLMFGLRENLDPALWQSCIEGLQKSAQREIT